MTLLVPFLLLLCAATPASAQTAVQIQTRVGDIEVRLYDANTPLTVANFLDYVDDRAYDDSVIHRSVSSFVIQGGGYVSTLQTITTNPSIPNETGIPNVRGTIAMAKLPGDPNSATSGWFINTVDNPALDSPANNGGYAVFGKATADGMHVVDKIEALTVVDFGGAFSTFPLMPSWASGLPTGFDVVAVERIVRLADDQCGDVNHDRVVDDDDPRFLQELLVGRRTLSGAGSDKCPVIASGTPCTILDWVVLARDLARMGPGITDVCPAQTP